MKTSLLAALAAIGFFAIATTIATRDGVSSDAVGFNAAMHAAMGQMARAMEQAPMSGDPDHDFLSMMIPHHQGAVEMARLELIHGTDPLARRLAEEIIASQQTEIEAMRGRLAALQAVRGADGNGFPVPHGTRGGTPTGK